jgi:hypothetical protein
MSKRSKDRRQLALFVPVDAARGEAIPANAVRARRSVTLSRAERAKLARANLLLTQLTEYHHHSCKCELCEPRWRTDCQDAESFTIPGVTLAADEQRS